MITVSRSAVSASWLVLFLGITIGSLGWVQAAPEGESPPPRISRITATSFLAEWATWPLADASTHYQLKLGTALYGGSTLNGWMEAKSLTPGAIYRVAVVTYHRGAVVDVSSATIILTAPPTPRLLKAWEIASTAVTISWEPVQTAIEYRVLVDDALATTVTASETRARLSGFKPGQVLSVTVVAVNQTGVSIPSKPLMVHLTPATPALKVVASDIGQTDFTLRWELVDGAASYTIALGSGTPFTVGSSTLNWTFNGLTPGASYSARIVALSIAGFVSQPGSLVVQLIPPTPPVPQARSITNSSFVLAWAPCRGATRYKVFYAGEYMLANVSASFTEALCRPFGPGETASMTVVASNESGDSPHSPVFAVTLTGTPTPALSFREAGNPAVGRALPKFSLLRPSPCVRELSTPCPGQPLLLLFTESTRELGDQGFGAILANPELEGVRVIAVQPRQGKELILPVLIDPQNQLRTWLFGAKAREGFCFLDDQRKLRSWAAEFKVDELEMNLYRAFPELETGKSPLGRKQAEDRARFQRLFEVE